MYNQITTEALERINSRKIKVCIIGLGRVGLPLAATLALEGFRVIGLDINPDVVNKTNSGESYLRDEKELPELIRNVVAKGLLKATLLPEEAIKPSDIIIITVPTLITKDKKPEISPVIDAAYKISENFSKGKVVIVESTVPPNTTVGIVGRIIEEKTGLKAGKDFGLAFSPERIQASQALRDLRKYPKIVGGIDEKTTEIVSAIYSTFAPEIIKMSNPLAAEIEKIIENTYRDVCIAFANELAKICEIYKVDVWEVIKAANSQPYCNILNPGCGVGGHCIPMDPYYIIRDVEQRGYMPRLLISAREVNESMPEHFVRIVEKVVKNKKAKIIILGLSFKPDVKAFLHSHTLKIIELLKKSGYENIVVHDPFLEDENFDFNTEKNLGKALKNSEALLLSTAHSVYNNISIENIARLMKKNAYIIDGRGFFDPKSVLKAGLNYIGIGRMLH